MAISFDTALGIHPLALKLREQRNDILAGNLANADTPNYKAQDLDFQAVLQGVDRSSAPIRPTVTQAAHQLPPESAFGSELKYRIPSQPSLDGNTVETEREHLRFAENAVQYQASLQFLSNKFIGLKTAIKGE
ncbi:MAG: flagellar basal body rod protein FlgB [Methylococcaceae bacterium]|nr:flagellar basal body rod protein FlgB [Methylococcaceae bacterium]